MDFRDLWESVPYPAFVLNVKNEIKLANPLSQQYCETSLYRLVGKKLSSYIGPNSAVFEVLDKISSNSSAIVKFDVPINWKNKGNQVFDMYAVSVETGLSNLIFFHPKRLKGKMEQALLNQSSIKSVSAMGSVLSHEIKNPLASIIGAAQLLESSNVKNKKALTQIILEEAKRIESIVDRVQLLGEINRLDFDLLNIHDVIDKVKRSASQGYGSHVSFEENYEGHNLEIVALTVGGEKFNIVTMFWRFSLEDGVLGVALVQKLVELRDDEAEQPSVFRDFGIECHYLEEDDDEEFQD